MKNLISIILLVAICLPTKVHSQDCNCDCDSLIRDTQMKKASGVYRRGTFSQNDKGAGSSSFEFIKKSFALGKETTKCMKKESSGILMIYEFRNLKSFSVEVITIFDENGFVEFYKNPSGYPVQVFSKLPPTEGEEVSRIYDSLKVVTQ